LTIVFAALAVARYLQDATGMSIKKIVRTLRPLQQVNVRIAGHDHLAGDPLIPTRHQSSKPLTSPVSDTPRVARVRKSQVVGEPKLAMIWRISAAASDGVLPTLTPAASRASCLAAAVPDEPDTIAPAWPIVLPSGAVNPAT
jgi:hypothetical protein